MLKPPRLSQFSLSLGNAAGVPKPPPLKSLKIIPVFQIIHI